MTGDRLSVVCVNFQEAADLGHASDIPARFRTLAEWGEALVDAGARVTVVQRFRRCEETLRNRVRYVCGPAVDLHRAVIAAGPDVVHVNGLIFPLKTWRLRAALPRDVALIVQDHGNRLDGRGLHLSPRRKLLRLGADAADMLWFSSAEQADGWRRAGVIRDGHQVRAVMEASTRMRAVPRERAARDSGVTGHPAVLWVGRLNANKDPFTVLDGFEAAVSTIPGATLTMVFGEDDLRPLVESRVRASDALRTRVRLVGAVQSDRMPFFHSAADVFVSGSHHEGSGYALLEACACGAIPAVTDIPSFRAITGGEIGHLFAAGDAQACARAILGAASQSGDAYRAAVVQRFERALSWPVLARRALGVYREAADLRRSARQVGA